jgi:L,D-peptidoglycan transpeptidase YkuD (ErfK/YbiS/YcfS/YnhG family)
VKATDLVVTPTHLRFLGRRFPCTVGRGGVTDAKREGDGATPRGTHRLVGMLYRPDRMERPSPTGRSRSAPATSGPTIRRTRTTT